MLDKIFLKLERFVPAKWRWILGHEGFRRYFANTGWMFFGQAFNLLIAFFIGIWIIRYLGPENYGVFSYVLAFTGLFFFIAGLGIDSILNRELVNHPEKRDYLLGTAFRLRLFGGLFALIFAIITIFIVDNSPLIRFLVSIYSFIFIIQSLNIIGTFFNSRVEAKKGVQAQVLAASISAVLKVALIMSGLGVIWLMFIYVLDSVWISIFLFLSYRRNSFKIRSWKFSPVLAKKMLSDSWLLALTSVSVLLYMKIDQVMIKQMMDEIAVGWYAAAVRLFEFSYIVPAMISASLIPAILNAKKTDLNSYRSRLKKMSVFLFFLSIFIALIISIFSGFIVKLLFGSDYLNSIMVLRIGAWSIIGISLSYVVGQYLIAENYIKIYFYITLIGAIINIGLNYLFIPIYGISGAAVVTALSYLVVPLSLVLFRKTRRDWGLVFKK